MPYISSAIRRQIRQAARQRCEYCPTRQDLTFATFHFDHIIWKQWPQAMGGDTEFENLCLSCPFCNQFKQGRVRARDPQTKRLVRLFNPRLDRWQKHFRWHTDGTQINGLTARGRATVVALRMNNPVALNARRFWVASGIHPPTD